MISTPFKIGLLVVAIVLALGSVAFLRLDNARLRQRIVDEQRRSERVGRLRDENTRTQQLLKAAAQGESAAAKAIREECDRVRAEVRQLELRAREKRAAMRAQEAADVLSLATNRDPEKGLVRLESFQRAGRATPTAAFQTFVWATMKGEDELLAQMIAIDAGAQKKATEIVLALPAGDRVKYSSPEKLAALFFADALTTMESAQVLEVLAEGPHRSEVHVRGLTERVEKFSMQWTDQGWQVVVSEDVAEKLGKWAKRVGVASPRRK